MNNFDSLVIFPVHILNSGQFLKFCHDMAQSYLSLSLLRHGPHTDETSCLSIFFLGGGGLICTKTSILCCSEEDFCLFIQVYIKKKVHWCNEVSHLLMSQSLFFCTSYFVIITMITLVTQLARPTNIAENCKHSRRFLGSFGMFYSFISFIFACLLVGVFYSVCCRFSLFTLLLSHVVTLATCI